MKKLNLLLVFATAIFFLMPQKAHAQVTALKGYFTDSLISYCTLPNSALFPTLVYATRTGTVSDSVTLIVNFGDGTEDSIKLGSYTGFSGTYAVIDGYLYHTYTLPGTYTARLICIAQSGTRDTAYSKSFTLSNSCGTLNGYLYVDANSNCINDASESKVYWTPIVTVNTTTLDTMNAGWANDTGHYSLSLAPANYNIIPNYYYTPGAGLTKANTFASPTCPTSSAYALSVASGGSYTKDFAYSCTAPTSFDAKVTVGSRGFIPGDSSYITLWTGDWSGYAAFACGSLSSTLTVTLDPMLSYLKPFFGPTPTLTGSTLTYTLATPAAVSHFYAGVWVKVPTTATIGDTIRISAYIAPTSLTDPNLANNTYSYKRAVASSFDPNMKEVAPQGNGKQGYIKANEEMTYTIHFQNTGTAAARNITITDDIDADLDISSLHILGASHNANTYRDGSKIRFRFENINLPDSGSDYAASMGAITYAIKQKKGLAPGTEMTNTAAIYFDYNEPIITNTTLNTINLPTSIENLSLSDTLASIYPNPANTSLNVKLSEKQAFTATMHDVLGRVVMTQGGNNGTMTIDTKTLNEGLYIISIADAKGNTQSSKVHIKH